MTLRRSFYFSFGRTGGQTIIQFLSNLVIARLLAPAELGVFVIAIAALMMLGALREFGISRYIIKEQELTKAKIATVFGVAIMISWSVAAMFFLARHQLARFYGTPELADLLAVLSLGYVVMPFGQIPLARLRREQRHSLLAANALMGSLSGSAVSITLVATGSGPIGLAIGMVSGITVSTALALRAYPEHVTMLPSLSEWRSVFGFGAVASLGAIVVQIGEQAPALVLGRMLGPAETALFQRANSLSAAIIGIVVTSSNWVTGAAVGELYRSGEDISRLTVRTTTYLTAITWPVLAFIAVKAEAIIGLLYGANWLDSAPLLPPLCLSFAMNVVVSQAAAVYDGTGAALLHLRNHSLSVMVVVLLLIFGSQYGLLAVAWLVPLATAARVAIHSSALRQYAGVGIQRLVLAQYKSAALAAGFGLVLIGMVELEPDGASGAPLPLVLEALAAVPAYLAVVFLVGHPLRKEIATLARRVVRRG